MPLIFTQKVYESIDISQERTRVGVYTLLELYNALNKEVFPAKACLQEYFLTEDEPNVFMKFQ
jgi:hypothetical protein